MYALMIDVEGWVSPDGSFSGWACAMELWVLEGHKVS